MIGSITGCGALDYAMMTGHFNVDEAVTKLEDAAAMGSLPTNQFDFDALLDIDFESLSEFEKDRLIRKVQKVYSSNGMHLDLKG